MGAGIFVALQRKATVHIIAEAIGWVESRGNYGAVGPATRSGNRAYGKYQVMDFNIPVWSQAIIGRKLTPQQWLADSGAQDAVVRAKIAEYLNQWGNAADVASVWFSGRPLTQAGNAADITGTTVPTYVQKVLDRMKVLSA